MSNLLSLVRPLLEMLGFKACWIKNNSQSKYLPFLQEQRHGDFRDCFDQPPPPLPDKKSEASR